MHVGFISVSLIGSMWDNILSWMYDIWRLVNAVRACFKGPWVSVLASPLHLHRSSSYVLVKKSLSTGTRSTLAQEDQSSCKPTSMKECFICTSEWQIQHKSFAATWGCVVVHRVAWIFYLAMTHMYWLREPYNFMEISHAWASSWYQATFFPPMQSGDRATELSVLLWSAHWPPLLTNLAMFRRSLLTICRSKFTQKLCVI